MEEWIGKPVLITWRRSDVIWPKFTLLGFCTRTSGEWIKLKRRAKDEGGPHTGGEFWTRLKDVEDIALDAGA